MTKLLNGAELAGYIKERQARQVRGLRQQWKVIPRLAIVKSSNASPVIEAYVRLKQRYGDDILVETDVHEVQQSEMPALIARLNADVTVHGIIVQLPLDDPSATDDIVALVSPQKDVDGLAPGTTFDSATAMAINWLLAGYGVGLDGKKIAIVGNGRLVGAPLARLWKGSGYDVTVLDRKSDDIVGALKASDVVVTATGSPRLITSTMLKLDAVVIDAGTASEDGVIVGDLDESVRQRGDLTVTPEKGGVGPLTISALFDNVIVAARSTIDPELL
jgi:methylenetetrahydrofolate dehydrogenase (NADP+)/methenyltetrahydrofolate cyclohydrolase